MKRNLKLMKYYYMTYGPVMLGPVVTLIYLDRGLDMFQILSLVTIMTFSTFVFEIPTGMVSDRISYKVSLFMGAFFIFLSLFMLALTSGYLLVALAEILFSLGFSLVSGTDSAMIYESLKNMGREDEYKQVYGSIRKNIFIANAIGAVISSFTYTINPNLPLYLSLVHVFIAMVIVLFMKEPKKEQTQSESYLLHIKEVFHYVYKHPKLKAIFFASATLMMFSRSMVNLYHPYFQYVEIEVVYYGVIFFFFNVVATFVSAHVNDYIKLTKRYSIIGMSWIYVLSFLILGFVDIKIGITGLFCHQIVRGLFNPVYTKHIHKHTPTSIRATTVSSWSLINNFAVSIFALFIGYIVDNNAIHITYRYLLVGMIIVTLLSQIVLDKALSKKSLVQ